MIYANTQREHFAKPFFSLFRGKRFIFMQEQKI